MVNNNLLIVTSNDSKLGNNVLYLFFCTNAANNSDTTYLSVGVDGLLNNKSSDESVVSLWQEHLVVCNKMKSTAESLVIPGVSGATAKQKE